VANTGLKVDVFSVSCRESVRVARKGLTERRFTVDSSKSTGERKKLEEDNAVTLRAQRWR
jgi:hypothetical protein